MTTSRHLSEELHRAEAEIRANLSSQVRRLSPEEIAELEAILDPPKKAGRISWVD